MGMFNIKRANELREEHGRTVAWLAKQLDRSVEVTNEYLSGKRTVKRPIAVTLAVAFGVSVAELWSADNNTDSRSPNAA